MIEEQKNDCFTVGTEGILKSPNVTAAPASVNRPIPVPSVYVDERGEIHNLQIGPNRRINLLYTRQGVMRSGDIHKNVQHDFVFSGRVEVWRLTKEGTQKTIYGANEYLEIQSYCPHIFHFLEDTVMAEWWTPQGFFAWFYNPYRRLVQDSFKPMRPGQFHLLKTDDNIDALDTELTPHYQKAKGTMWMFTGLALGIAIGYALGRKRS